MTLAPFIPPRPKFYAVLGRHVQRPGTTLRNFGRRPQSLTDSSLDADRAALYDSISESCLNNHQILTICDLVWAAAIHSRQLLSPLKGPRGQLQTAALAAFGGGWRPEELIGAEERPSRELAHDLTHGRRSNTNRLPRPIISSWLALRAGARG